jgi:hypothetical protein
MSHPIATQEQHAQELAALELTRHPVVQKAYADVREHWLAAMEPSPVMRECFDAAFEEVMFSATIWSSNQDPLRPQITTITRLTHPSIYRVIPISGEEKYVIRGRVGANRMTENYFTLWDPNMGTVDVCNGSTLQLDADGSFEITVSSDPAGDNPNHVQSSPEAHEFYIRDVMLNWDRDDPNWLEVERIGGQPRRPARSLDEQATLTAEFMLRYADFTTSLSKGTFRRAANDFSLAVSGDTTGMLRNQVYVGGLFRLEEDEAFLIHLNDGGAAYFTVPIANVWGTTLDILEHTSSLNKAQSAVNPDGTYTYVLSPQDPGVHNWLDTCGLREGMLTLRMAEFPGQRPREDLSARGEVVKLADLGKVLPDGTVRVDAAGRSAQQSARASAYKRRLPELDA